MKLAKIVKDVFREIMEEAGYTYVKAHSIVWSYEKKMGDVTLMIAVMRHRYLKGKVKMLFRSSAYGQRDRELSDIVPGVKVEFWSYETEEDFRAVMIQFREWILEYGFELMEKISTPTTEERPKPETDKYLYENHEELNRKYRELFGLGDADTGQVLCFLQVKVRELREREMPFKEVEDILIGMAAVFGHSLCLYGIGEWTWYEKYQACIVDKLGGTGASIYPLNDVILEYSYLKGDYFLNIYSDVLRSRNTCIEAKRIKGELVDVKEFIKKIKEEHIKLRKDIYEIS